jgi:hypothetical protein
MKHKKLIASLGTSLLISSVVVSPILGVTQNVFADEQTNITTSENSSDNTDSDSEENLVDEGERIEVPTSFINHNPDNLSRSTKKVLAKNLSWTNKAAGSRLAQPTIRFNKVGTTTCAASFKYEFHYTLDKKGANYSDIHRRHVDGVYANSVGTDVCLLADLNVPSTIPDSSTYKSPRQETTYIYARIPFTIKNSTNASFGVSVPGASASVSRNLSSSTVHLYLYMEEGVVLGDTLQYQYWELYELV